MAGGGGAAAVMMRQATAGFIDVIHRTYADETRSLPPAVRARLPLVADGPFQVAAVGLRNLHLLATHDQLEPCGNEAMDVSGSEPPLSWTLRFYDVGVLPALQELDESSEPDIDGVRRVLGVGTTLYHLVLHDGATISPHSAGHIGTGLANSHAAVVTDFATMRRYAHGHDDLVDELECATTAGLRNCQRLLARALVPDDPAVAEIAGAQPLDSIKLRRAVLGALRNPGQVTA